MSLKRTALYGSLLSVAALAFLLPFGCSPGQPNPDSEPRSMKVSPVSAKAPSKTVSTFDDALAHARSENKAIYLEFSAAWCGPCKVFKNRVLSDPQVRRAMNDVVFLTVDIDRDPDLARRFNITGVPTGVLLNVKPAGYKIVDKHVGGLSKPQFLSFLQKTTG